jgi:O-succinylbenzoic acid--CoA ligase
VFDLVAGKLAAPKTMRVVLVGGGAMSVEVEQAAQALGWPVRRTYGMTETASQVASQRTAGGEMEVLPIWVVSTDADGLLMVRGEALAQGYAVHENEKWRWEPIPAATGLRTRDRVSLQWENGWCSLRFIGRESGIVKILGELVALGPIQSWIDDLRLKLGLYAGEAVVCDIPDTRKEAKLALAVSGMSPAEAARLQKSLNEMLRPLEQIEDVWMLTSIARGELDKVRLEELRRQLTLPSEQSHPTV